MQTLTTLFFLTILPGIISYIGFFIPSLTYPLKAIVPLSLTALYFVGLALFLQSKTKKAQTNVSNLNTRLDSHDEFVHKRKLFINHELEEIVLLITEYDGHVKNSYRGHRYQELRNEVSSVKKRALEIINKEKRDFDEQLYKIQSNKDNR